MARSAGAGVLDTRKAESGWVRRAQDFAPFERIEAFFAGRGYEMHRHDTYAIGRTYSGVQSFHYRGAVRDSLPGGSIVLHPDEVHDGQAGAEGGFLYRMIYVEPALLQTALAGRALPYVRDGLSNSPGLYRALDALMVDVETPLEALEYEDALFDLGKALVSASDDPDSPQATAIDRKAAEQARQVLRETGGNPISLGGLEVATGRDRWALSRDFRQLFGTSPHRYLVMRRLERFKAALAQGVPLAQAAVDAGFADQSHMARHFKQAYGMTPGQYRKVLAA